MIHFKKNNKSGAEYYLLDFDVASKELSRRVKLYFGGFRYHDIAAIRLVGAVAGTFFVDFDFFCKIFVVVIGMTIPNNPGRPLDGIFAKDTFSLTQPRQMTNVECKRTLFFFYLFRFFNKINNNNLK